MSIHELEIVTSISECGAQIQIVKLLYMATEISAQQRAEYWIRKVFDPYRMHYGVGNDGAFCGGYSLYRLDDLLCLIIGTTCQDQPYALEVYKLMCRSHNSSEVVTALNGLGKVGTERKDWKFALPMVCFFVNSHPCWYVGAAQAFCDLHSALSQETAPWWIAEAHGIARVLASFSTQMSNAASETQIAPLRNRAQKLLEKLKEEYRSDDGVLRLLE